MSDFDFCFRIRNFGFWIVRSDCGFLGFQFWILGCGFWVRTLDLGIVDFEDLDFYFYWTFSNQKLATKKMPLSLFPHLGVNISTPSRSGTLAEHHLHSVHHAHFFIKLKSISETVLIFYASASSFRTSMRAGSSLWMLMQEDFLHYSFSGKISLHFLASFRTENEKWKRRT